jgi:NADH:ubiquinone oxidoreductase subunit E
METDSTMRNGFARKLWRTEGRAGDLIPLLQAAQDSYGYVPQSAMEAIAGTTGIPMAEIYGVVTFYKQFRLTPRGKYVVKVCNGTACHVNGSGRLESTIEDNLGIRRGETDGELVFTLESVNCVGCCSLAPVVMVNDDTHGSLTSRKLTTLLKRLRKEAGGKPSPAEG